MAANASASALLLVAALSKMVAPGQLVVALGELIQPLDLITAKLIRLVAVIEFAASVTLLFAPIRMLGAALAAVLGLAFALAGLTGIARGTQSPCGCLGISGGRTLGPTNILAGVLLIGLFALNRSELVPPSSSGEYSRAAILAVAGLSLALCLGIHRQLVRVSWHAKLPSIGRATS